MTARPLYAVIMAGGVGSRLWPYSRRGRPKQLLPLLGERTMLQATCDRLSPLVPPERVLVVTNREYVGPVREQLPEVPAANVIGEPSGLGTAPAVALAAGVIRGRFGDGVMACMPADHVMEPADGFRSTLELAAEVARQGRLVTVGIEPTVPATGFGYIQLGAPLTGFEGAFEVQRFVEKPDLEHALAFVESGDYLWNAGLFIWDLETLHEEYHRYLPRLGRQIGEIAELAARPGGGSGPEAVGGVSSFEAGLEVIWRQVTDRTTVDYGIVERSSRVACVPGRFKWDDVGSWSALAEVLDADEQGNIVVGSHVGVESRRCVVFAGGGRTVATVGLQDLIVVDVGDAVLVCARDYAQDVKQIVELLEARGLDGLL